MKNRAKYLVSDTKLGIMVPKRAVKIRKAVQIKEHVRRQILTKTMQNREIYRKSKTHTNLAKRNLA